MKICVAQTKPIKGDIAANIENHKRLIDLAISHGADTIVFPELSLTGYEPGLAKQLATDKDDHQFDDFQTISNGNQITIGAGMPVKTGKGICIGMIIFQPGKPRQLYCKKYLHADEEPFFVHGENSGVVIGTKPAIALAICYEVFVPEHAATAFDNGGKIYLASVAKSAKGMEKAMINLPQLAVKYGMTVLMSNCVGYCDNFLSVGKSSAWNDKGELIGQLSEEEEGILIYDTDIEGIVFEPQKLKDTRQHKVIS